jgi:hypothetical protein
MRPGYKPSAMAFSMVCLWALPLMAATDPFTACETASAGHAFVCFDHAAGRWIKSVGEISRANDALAVVVINTDKAHITASIKEVAKPKTESLAACAKDQASVDTIYPDGEGRYSLEITVSGCEGLSNVAPTEFKVDILGWEQSVAGAFMGSNHHDPLFSTYTRKNGDQTFTFVDQEPQNREDDVRLGLGSFIHLYHERAGRGLWGLLPSGFSFGLGIGEKNRTTYALAPSWRLGDKAFLSVGYSWAPVDRLPNGVRICSRSSDSCDATLALTDPNRIATLSQQTKGAWFVGLSYTFIQLGTFFQDRFKEAIKAGSTAPASPTGQVTAPAVITKDDLELKLDKAEYKPGEVLKLTAKATKDPGDKRLRIVVPDALESSALGDWEACSGTPNCFELKKDKFTVNTASVIQLKVKAGASAGTFKAVLSVGDVKDEAIDIKIVATAPVPAPILGV